MKKYYLDYYSSLLLRKSLNLFSIGENLLVNVIQFLLQHVFFHYSILLVCTLILPIFLFFLYGFLEDVF